MCSAICFLLLLILPGLFPAEYELRKPRMVIVLFWCGDYKNIPRPDGRSPVIDSYTPIESEHPAHDPTFSFLGTVFLEFLLFSTRVDCFATMSLGRTDQSAPRQDTGDAPTVRIGSCDCELKKEQQLPLRVKKKDNSIRSSSKSF